MRLDIRHRTHAAGKHLLISAAVAASAAGLVFGLWYPGPYRLLAGGRDLFVLVMSVDVIIGPLLTLVVFNLSKAKADLRRDLVIIGALQLAALLYGLHTVYQARPVAMVFEVDRFRLITASNVSLEDLTLAAPEYRTLSVTGPRLLGTRRPRQGEERNDALFKGIAGIDIGNRPLFWQPYELSRVDAIARSQPVDTLRASHSSSRAVIDEGLAAMKADSSSARFLPVMARNEWVVVMDQTGNVLGFLPFNGFL